MNFLEVYKKMTEGSRVTRKNSPNVYYFINRTLYYENEEEEVNPLFITKSFIEDDFQIQEKPSPFPRVSLMRRGEFATERDSHSNKALLKKNLKSYWGFKMDKKSPEYAFFSTFVYNVKGNISQEQIDERFHNLVREEPFSSLYCLLCDESFKITFNEELGL